MFVSLLCKNCCADFDETCHENRPKSRTTHFILVLQAFYEDNILVRKVLRCQLMKFFDFIFYKFLLVIGSFPLLYGIPNKTSHYANQAVMLKMLVKKIIFRLVMIYYDEREVRKTSFGLHKTTKKLLQRDILKNLINTRFFLSIFSHSNNFLSL